MDPSDRPRQESVEAFVAALRTHSSIESVDDSEQDDFKISITLGSGKQLRLFLVDIYCVGEADVLEILSENPDTDVIVTLSSWNQVTRDARDFTRERSKGAFTWRDFFGAINYRKYWLYEPMPVGIDPSRIDQEKRRRRLEWN